MIVRMRQAYTNEFCKLNLFLMTKRFFQSLIPTYLPFVTYSTYTNTNKTHNTKLNRF